MIDRPAIPFEEPTEIEPWTLHTHSRSRLDFSPAWQGKAVKLTGTVREIQDDDGTSHLTLTDGSHVLSVDASACPHVLEGIRVGSTLAVSGTCVLESESYNTTTLFPLAKGPSSPSGVRPTSPFSPSRRGGRPAAS